MNFEERALTFPCHDSWLFGVLSIPERALARGVLILVGGPQYRVGSHRQFVLLARYLATHGVPVMRFDYRGMGDSEGHIRTFEDVGDDLREAMNQFFAEVRSMKEVVVWGLCDAASAALFYAYQDRRVCGLVLLNPWVRTDDGQAKAYLRHYYIGRLFHRDLWSKVISGRFDYAGAACSVFNLAAKALPGRKKRKPVVEPEADASSVIVASLPDRMFDGLDRFQGKVLLIISGNDLTAKEFTDLAKRSRKWKTLLASSRVQRRDLPQANHTFSRRDWRDQVSCWTREWIMSW